MTSQTHRSYSTVSLSRAVLGQLKSLADHRQTTTAGIIRQLVDDELERLAAGGQSVGEWVRVSGGLHRPRATLALPECPDVTITADEACQLAGVLEDQVENAGPVATVMLGEGAYQMVVRRVGRGLTLVLNDVIREWRVSLPLGSALTLARQLQTVASVIETPD